MIEQKLLSGRYVLREVIGMGGMSIVYRAWDTRHDREVAVKVLRPEYGTDAEFVRRFNQEAQAASRMSHPNIVSMFDLGQDGDLRYLVMEYVSGTTLKDIIRSESPMSAQRAVQITLKILAAVNHAHNNHIVHRDIKPQNILVKFDGTIKVADFGIARVTNRATMTSTFGNMLGSVHYFSPEQASGEVADEKSDLYSVGVVFYEMITGKVPFDGDTPVSVALKHVSEPATDPRAICADVSPALSEVALKALSKSPDERYQTAVDFATDLKKALKNPQGGFVKITREEPMSQRESARVHNHKRRMKRMRFAMMIAIAVLFVCGAVFAGKIIRDVINRVNVPTFVLMNVDDAKARIAELGLECAIEERHNNEYAAGVVYEQMPEYGTQMQRGDTVRLVVSLGKEKIMMPKLLGSTRSEAIHLLEQEGLLFKGAVLQVSDAVPGTVVGQTPAPNEWVNVGAQVTLIVSGESGHIPDLTGLTETAARDMLAQYGFVAGNVTSREDEAEPGTVIDQTVAPNTLCLLGQVVDVVLSRETPVVYQAKATLSVPVKADGDEVVCTLAYGDAEPTEVYRQKLKAGAQSITLDLTSDVGGEHRLSVYVAGELVMEKVVVLE